VRGGANVDVEFGHYLNERGEDTVVARENENNRECGMERSLCDTMKVAITMQEKDGPRCM
jgi:hypothetical protein